MNKRVAFSKVVKSNTEKHLPHATLKDAVQKRIIPADHSSLIPGIDVNELKHSLDLLKYALDYSEAIVETVMVPLIVLNKKLKVLTANRAFYDTFSLTSKETENKLIYRLHNNAWNIPKLKILLEKILPANTNFDNYQMEIDLPHLGIRTIQLNARRTYRQVNNTEAILLAFEDITDRKRLEDQKDDFIGIVSHELKTPLTSIKVFSQMLDKYLHQNNDEKGVFYLSKMTAQIERLTQLMASFVNVYQIQNGKLALHSKVFDIDELIQQTVADFSFTTQSHLVSYTSPGKVKLFADRERIAQVLINLISNAIKYSPQNDKVIITLSKEKKSVLVSVRDFGLGIAKGEKNKVFERFFRIKDKREKNISGLGLGLYISSEIIKQHHGKIWVDSIQGKGSSFHFILPIVTGNRKKRGRT